MDSREVAEGLIGQNTRATVENDSSLAGMALGARLDGSQGRAVMLVLIALQKLASSSVAAVKSALQKRLGKLRQMSSSMQQHREEESSRIPRLESLLDDADSYNLIAEDEITKLSLDLMENECDRLGELIAAANMVTAETKIETIVKSIRQLSKDESVLLFTGYKITQSLLLSALWKEFGDRSATFINGDNALPDVLTSTGVHRAFQESRESAKDRFNSGNGRFLVSTEAAGEGIDLQERCSRLSYLDLTPLGRQETWEDSPEGYPQTPPYKWWNWHDNYEAEAAPDPNWVQVSTAGEAAFRKCTAEGEGCTCS